MKNNIDKLLNEWDRQHNPTFKDKDKLKQVVLDELASPQAKGLKGKGEYFIIHKSLVYISSIAAAFVICTIAVFMTLNVTQIKEYRKVAPLTTLSNEHLNELKMVKKEVEHLFPEGIAWVFKCKNSMEIVPTEKQTDNSTGKLLIHHVVLKKVNGKWQEVYMADIMTRHGEPVLYNKDGISKTYLWTHKLDHNKFALEGQLRINANGTILDLEFVGGQELGKNCLLKTVKKGNNIYRVYQTIREI